MYRHVTPFRTINTSLSSCSLRDGTINFVRYASRILLLRVCSGALVSTYQLNSWSIILAKCFAGSELLLTPLRSSYLILQFLIVSPTYVSLHEQILFKITELKGWTLSFDGNNNWILCVFKTILNLNFSLMKETNFIMKYTEYSPFFEENGKSIVTCFLSSNNHGGIKSSSFFLLKLLKVFQ